MLTFKEADALCGVTYPDYAKCRKHFHAIIFENVADIHETINLVTQLIADDPNLHMKPLKQWYEVESTKSKKLSHLVMPLPSKAPVTSLNRWMHQNKIGDWWSEYRVPFVKEAADAGNAVSA